MKSRRKALCFAATLVVAVWLVPPSAHTPTDSPGQLAVHAECTDGPDGLYLERSTEFTEGAPAAEAAPRSVPLVSRRAASATVLLPPWRIAFGNVNSRGPPVAC